MTLQTNKHTKKSLNGNNWTILVNQVVVFNENRVSVWDGEKNSGDGEW